MWNVPDRGLRAVSSNRPRADRKHLACLCLRDDFLHPGVIRLTSVLIQTTARADMTASEGLNPSDDHPTHLFREEC